MEQLIRQRLSLHNGMIYSLYIFDRHSDCIFRREWHKDSGKKAGINDDMSKLIFGICLSLRNIARNLTDSDSFLTYSTSQYKTHYYETPSNLKLVLFTDLLTVSLVNELRQIYETLYVEYVVKNPLQTTEVKTIDNIMFSMGVDALIQSLPGYA